METYLKTSNMRTGLSAGRSEYRKKPERYCNRMTFLLLSGLWLWLLSSCIPDRAKDGHVITFMWETRRGEIRLCAAEGKAVEIAWGDMKKDRFEGDGTVHTLNHTYSMQGIHRVAIRGDVTLLECNKSNLTSLNVRRNSVLTVLRCNQNRLKTLNIRKNTSLSILDCSGNQLTTLDVSGLDSLKVLSCSGNQLTTLDVSGLNSLDSLHCRDNQLTGLNVSGLDSLKILSCSGNRLTALHTGENTALEKLDCSHNQLTHLDVSKNSALTELLCNNNVLTELNMNEKSVLTRINIRGNRLPPKEMTLIEAVNRKKVDFSANGSSIQSSLINLTNLSDEKLKLSIPPGTYLSARSGSVQNMVITGQYTIELDPKEKKTLYVNTACMNMYRSIPGSDNHFSIAQRPESNLLSKVITLLRNGNYSYPVIQAAVWIVTDNASYNDVGILQSNFSRVIDRDDYNTARKIVNEARKK